MDTVTHVDILTPPDNRSYEWLCFLWFTIGGSRSAHSIYSSYTYGSGHPKKYFNWKVSLELDFN